jgi:hypothetical protein
MGEAMKHLLAATLAAASLALTPTARAGIFVTGSVSDQTTHLVYTASETEYGSASVDIELGRYVRLGYTYGMEVSKSTTFKDPTAPDGTQQTSSGYCQQRCDKTFQNETVVSHAVNLTLVLYEGQTFMPFLLGGAIKKIITMESLDYDHTGNLVYTPPQSSTLPIVPQIGGGIGIRLNRSFSLKFTYQVSPGVVLMPENPKPSTVWDRQWSVGLQYQL